MLNTKRSCTFYNTDVETIDHLFFYCAYSCAFWEEFEYYWIPIAKELTMNDNG